MSDACAGMSSTGRCEAQVRYRVQRPAGKDVKSWVACGRHLGWLVGFVTVPGGKAVSVVQLKGPA